MSVNVYVISREWFDFSFENPEKIKPAHGSIYFFAIDQNNRLGWKDKFGFPTLHAMEATGIKSKNTYYKAFHDLVEWNFITVVEMSKNSNTANIISINAVLKFKSVNKSVGKSVNKSALDKANIQQEDSRGNIDKQVNKKQLNQKQENGFKPPSLDEVYNYMSEKGLNNFLANNESQKFINHYTSNGWKVGKNKMKNWKSAVSQWISRMKDYQSNMNFKKENNEKRSSQNGEARIGRTTNENLNRIINPEEWAINKY